MNTADRSVEALDTALRRRFSFIEMTPDSEVLKNENITKCGRVIFLIYWIQLILELKNFLIKIIALDTPTFSNFKEDSSLNMLRRIFNDKIIPLLQEYFYGDFEKIGLVLGNAFIEESNTNIDVFHKGFHYEDVDLLSDRKAYKFSDVNKLSEKILSLSMAKNKTIRVFEYDEIKQGHTYDGVSFDERDLYAIQRFNDKNKHRYFT